MKAAEKHCSSLAGQIQHTGVWPRDLPLHYFEKAMEQASKWLQALGYPQHAGSTRLSVYCRRSFQR